MSARSAVEEALRGPGRELWSRCQNLLPPRVTETIRTSGKRVLGRAGVDVHDQGVRWRRRVGSMKVDASWPGIAEQRDDNLRGEVFEHLAGPGEGRTLLDLGAGPCQFAQRAQRLGWKVTAVDARTERLPKDLEGVEFIEADVREFDPKGYHTVAILGLLYHLELTDQEALLRRCNSSRVILETQVHTPGYVPPDAEPWGRRIKTVDGLRGVVFPEGDNPMASVGNPTSLWLTEEDLLRLIDRCGYRHTRVIEPAHHSKYGTRKFYVLDGKEQG